MRVSSNRNADGAAAPVVWATAARAVLLVLFVAAGCWLSGCAPHARVICESLELLYSGQPASAVTAIDATKLAKSGHDRFLYHAQRGHLLHLAGEFEASNREFEAAAAVSEELEPWSVTETLTDYTLNETVKAYSGEDYERAYLHYYMALNYLEMDDLDGALVECRRVDEVFRELDARYEDDGRYQDDGFIRYLSGLIYEAMGKRDDARVDYRLAVRAYDERLGGETGVDSPEGLLASLEEAEQQRPMAGGAGAPTSEIVVIIDSGWAPYKVEKSVEVPIHRALVPEELRGRTNLAALVKVAYPELVSVPGGGARFRAGLDTAGPDSLGQDSAGQGRPRQNAAEAGAPVYAERVQDMDALARWALERRKPAIILRSTLRATAKQVALARAKHEREEDRDKDSGKRSLARVDDDGGILKAILGWLFEDLVTTAVAETEQADTRGWVLLPAKIWMARIPVEPGVHEVLVQADDGTEAVSLGTVTVPPGGKVFRSARFFGAPHPVRCDD